MKECSFILRLILGVLAIAPLRLLAGEEITYSGSRQSAPEVEDIGEISEAPVPGTQSSRFSVTGSARADFTSNGALSGSRSSSDLIFFPSVHAEYSTGLGHGLTFDLNANVESGLYSDRTERSFVGYGAQATIDWRYRTTYPRFYVGAEPYRFDNYDRGGLITEAIGVIAGSDWGFSFNGGRSYLFLGYTFENYFSDPNIDTRAANRAVLGVTHQIKPQLFAEAFYEYQYSDYFNISREDSRNSVSVSLIWQMSSHLFANLSGSLVKNHSSELDASYEAAIASVGLTWQF